MAGERSPVGYEKRQHILQMRKGGASYDQIAKAFGVSKTWISRFLRKRDEELAQLRGAGAVTAGAPALAPAAPPTTAALEPADGEGGTTADNIADLERELAELKTAGRQALDPLDRAKIATAISQITVRLAALRRDEAKARPTGADEGVRRAAAAAGKKLRDLVEEALGEKIDDEPEAEPDEE